MKRLFIFSYMESWYKYRKYESMADETIEESENRASLQKIVIDTENPILDIDSKITL